MKRGLRPSQKVPTLRSKDTILYKIAEKKKTGGGVAFYVAEHLHFTKIESLSIMEKKVFESLFINIEIDGKKCICGTVYRSPKQNHGTFSKTLRDVMKELSKINKRTIIVGDLNYNLLADNYKHVNNCVDTFFEFGYFPLINLPTRITSTAGSALDHIWTNIIDMPVKSAVIVNEVSDHLPTYLNIGTSKSINDTVIQKRIFSEKNTEAFNNYLHDMPISDILDTKDTDTAYNLFTERYLKIFEKAFPIRKCKKMVKKRVVRNPWYTRELLELNKVKEMCYKKYINNKNNMLLELKYKLSKNEYFSKVKSAKKTFYQNYLIKVKNDVKGTWKVINKVLGRGKSKQLFKLSVNSLVRQGGSPTPL